MKKFENPIMNIKEFDRILATEMSSPEPKTALEAAKNSFNSSTPISETQVFEFKLKTSL